jgi:methylated-DNA-[protein]-cysteine S-methyltransferase
MRAVGAPDGRNPISIIAPRHRVVGPSGALTGFAGGLAAKRILLELEGRAGAAVAVELLGTMARAIPIPPGPSRWEG